MATPLLPYQPTSTNYKFTPANNVIATKLDGGASRRRRDIVGGAHLVDCTWILERYHYTRFQGFFQERLLQGTRPFRMNMLLDVAVVVPYVCVCADDLPQLVQQEGDAYWLRCLLEVTPNPTKQYGIHLESDADDRVVAGNADGTVTAEMNEFPVGRQIIITGSAGSLPPVGNPVNFDGQYEIFTKPTTSAITLVNAPLISPSWTVLNGTTPDTYANVFMAVILLPE